MTRARDAEAHKRGDERKAHARGNGPDANHPCHTYDNGMGAVDGVPINESSSYERGHGWLGAAETITITLGEFRRQAIARQKKIRRTKSIDQTVQSV